ncbi:ABC transporter ATP-binding protein [Zavarzinia compransoris]|uniref:ABC transporter n=1 Tax=Zavarzinia compransoris TaxID=1264899 RepID=A0A317E087_9PROT|nr:ABC transporter ATP-binding protein [Zavarzinia compransoris]PWR20487.1 ABC transporter [Zavarzinia compransoris]TDP43868.1 iron complex transport system ATP-binding protein [Zavarzinia compransoris]
MALIALDGLAFGHGGRAVGTGIALSLAAGEVLCLLGPNGSGKTSLLKTVLGLLPPLAGRVLIGGEDARGWPPARRARALAHVPQSAPDGFAFSVLDMVLMGRTARLGPFGHPGTHDRALAARALERLGIAALAGRAFTGLSGGERQLVLIARALAQEADAILLDEPTASLDFANQERVLAVIAGLKHDGLAVVFTTHHPDHAFAVADRAALLRDGRLIGQGPVGDVLSEAALGELYGTPVRVVEVAGRRLCLAAQSTAIITSEALTTP